MSDLIIKRYIKKHPEIIEKWISSIFKEISNLSKEEKLALKNYLKLGDEDATNNY